MSKELTLEQSGWNGGAVELHKRPLLSPAAFMDRTRNQLLARTGFSEKQHRRVARGYGFHQLQNMTESRTLPHNFFEVDLAPDFILQIQLLLGKLVFEISDLTIRQRVLHPNRYLLCDLRQEFSFRSIERILFPFRYRKHAQCAAPADEGHVAH